MSIRLTNKDDCLEVAKLHIQEIKLGFLSELGEKFLYYFYLAMIDSPNAFLIVAEDNGSIIGFISGCIDLKKFYKEFVKKYSPKVFFILLKKFFNLKTIKNILETIKYAGKEKKNLPKAELLALAVKKEFQGQGIAGKMLEKFVWEMKTRKVSDFKVIVGEELSPAIRFYEKNGFKFHSKNFVHQNRPSMIHIYNIGNKQL